MFRKLISYLTLICFFNSSCVLPAFAAQHVYVDKNDNGQFVLNKDCFEDILEKVRFSDPLVESKQDKFKSSQKSADSANVSSSKTIIKEGRQHSGINAGHTTYIDVRDETALNAREINIGHNAIERPSRDAQGNLDGPKLFEYLIEPDGHCAVSCLGLSREKAVQQLIVEGVKNADIRKALMRDVLSIIGEREIYNDIIPGVTNTKVYRDLCTQESDANKKVAAEMTRLNDFYHLEGKNRKDDLKGFYDMLGGPGSDLTALEGLVDVHNQKAQQKREYLLQPEIFETIIKHGYGMPYQDNWFYFSYDAIDVLAEINGLHVIIKRLSADNTYDTVHEYPLENGRVVIMLHTMAGTKNGFYPDKNQTLNHFNRLSLHRGVLTSPKMAYKNMHNVNKSKSTTVGGDFDLIDRGTGSVVGALNVNHGGNFVLNGQGNSFYFSDLSNVNLYMNSLTIGSCDSLIFNSLLETNCGINLEATGLINFNKGMRVTRKDGFALFAGARELRINHQVDGGNYILLENLKKLVVKEKADLKSENLIIKGNESTTVLNNGTIDVPKGLMATGIWQNSEKGIVKVGQYFEGDFQKYQDDGKTTVLGLAAINADNGRITKNFLARCGIILFKSRLDIPLSASFKVYDHLTLHTDDNLQLHSHKISLGKCADLPVIEISKDLGNRIRRLPKGIFISANKNFSNNSTIRSDNTSIVLRAKGKYTEKGGYTRSGFFNDNNITICSEVMAQLNGEIRSYNDLILQSKIAELNGTRQIDKNMVLDVGDLRQHEGDINKVFSIVGTADNAVWGGKNKLGNKGKMALQVAGMLKTDDSFQIKNGEMSIQANEAQLSGNLEDAKVTVNAAGTITLKQGLQGDVATSTLRGEKIIHEQGSKLKVAGTNIEVAKNEILIEKGARLEAQDNILKTLNNGRILNYGFIKSHNSYFADTGFHWGGKNEAHQATVYQDLWNLNLGSICSFNSIENNALINFNIFSWHKGNDTFKSNGLLNLSLGSSFDYKKIERNALIDLDAFCEHIGRDSVTVNALGAYSLGSVYLGNKLPLNALHSKFYSRGAYIPCADLINSALGVDVRPWISRGLMVTGNAWNAYSLASPYLGDNFPVNPLHSQLCSLGDYIPCAGLGNKLSLNAFYSLGSYVPYADLLNASLGSDVRPWISRGLTVAGYLCSNNPKVTFCINGVQLLMSAHGLIEAGCKLWSVTPNSKADEPENYWRPSRVVNRMAAYLGPSIELAGQARLVTKSGINFYEAYEEQQKQIREEQERLAEAARLEKERQEKLDAELQEQSEKDRIAEKARLENERQKRLVMERFFKLRELLAGKQVAEYERKQIQEKLDKDPSITEGCLEFMEDYFFKNADESKRKLIQQQIDKDDEKEAQIEQERLAEEVRMEQERLAEEVRMEQERLAEEVRIEQDPIAKAERLEQTRLSEEARLAKERQQKDVIERYLKLIELQSGKKAVQPEIKRIQEQLEKNPSKTDEYIKSLEERFERAPESTRKLIQEQIDKELAEKARIDAEREAEIEEKRLAEAARIEQERQAQLEKERQTLSEQRWDFFKGVVKSFLHNGRTINSLFHEDYGSYILMPYKTMNCYYLNDHSFNYWCLSNNITAYTGEDRSTGTFYEATIDADGDFIVDGKKEMVKSYSAKAGGNLTKAKDSQINAGKRVTFIAGQHLEKEDGSTASAEHVTYHGNSTTLAGSLQGTSKTLRTTSGQGSLDMHNVTEGSNATNHIRGTGYHQDGTRRPLSEAGPYTPPPANVPFTGEYFEIQAPGDFGIEGLYDQTGPYENYKYNKYVKVITDQHVQFTESRNSAAKSFELWANKISTAPNVHLNSPEFLILRSTLEDMDLAAGTKLEAGRYLEARSKGDIITKHAVRVITNETQLDKKRKITTEKIEYDNVTFIGGTGIPYEYTDPDTGITSVRLLGLMIDAGGKFNGIGAKFEATSDIWIRGQRIINKGVATVCNPTKRYEKHTLWSKDEKSTDTAFLRGTASTPGKVILQTTAGGLDWDAPLFNTAGAADLLINGPIKMLPLEGLTGNWDRTNYKYKKTMPLLFLVPNEILDENLRKTKERENGLFETALLANQGDCKFRILARGPHGERYDINTPGLVYKDFEGGKSTLQVFGNVWNVERPILNNMSRSSAPQVSFDYNIGSQLMSLEVFQNLKDVTQNLNQGEYLQGGKELLNPQVKLSLLWSVNKSKWQTLGQGGIGCDRVEFDLKTINQSNGYGMRAPGGGHARVGTWNMNGVALNFSHTNFNFGLFAGDNGGPGAGVQAGYSQNTGWTWESVRNYFGKDMHFDVDVLNLNNAHMVSDNPKGIIRKIVANTEQNKSITRGVTVAVDVFQRKVNGSFNYQEQYRNNDRSGMTVKDGSGLTIDEAELYNGSTLKNVVPGKLISTAARKEVHRGGSFGLGTGPNGLSSLSGSVIMNGHEVGVAVDLQNKEGRNNKNQLFNKFGTAFYRNHNNGFYVNGIPLFTSVNGEAWRKFGKDINDLGGAIVNGAFGGLSPSMDNNDKHNVKENELASVRKMAREEASKKAQQFLEQRLKDQGPLMDIASESPFTNGNDYPVGDRITSLGNAVIPALSEAKSPDNTVPENEAVVNQYQVATALSLGAAPLLPYFPTENPGQSLGGAPKNLGVLMETPTQYPYTKGLNRLNNTISHFGTNFKYHLSGTEFFLHSPKEAGSMYRIMDELMLHPSPYVREAGNAIYNSKINVFIYEFEFLPFGSENSVGRFLYYKNNTSIALARRANLSNIPFASAFAHEGDHLRTWRLNLGLSTNPAFNRLSKEKTLLNTERLIRCFGEDATNSGIKSFLSGTKFDTKTHLLFERTWLYMINELNEKLANIPTYQRNQILRQFERTLLQGGSFIEVFGNTPYVNAVWNSIELGAIELSPQFVNVEYTSPGIVEEFCPKATKYLNELELSKSPNNGLFEGQKTKPYDIKRDTNIEKRKWSLRNSSSNSPVNGQGKNPFSGLNPYLGSSLFFADLLLNIDAARNTGLDQYSAVATGTVQTGINTTVYGSLAYIFPPLIIPTALGGIAGEFIPDVTLDQRSRLEEYQQNARNNNYWGAHSVHSDYAEGIRAQIFWKALLTAPRHLCDGGFELFNHTFPNAIPATAEILKRTHQMYHPEQIGQLDSYVIQSTTHDLTDEHNVPTVLPSQVWQTLLNVISGTEAVVDSFKKLPRDIGDEFLRDSEAFHEDFPSILTQI